MTAHCFFKTIPGTGRCDGSPVRCHLIPKDKLKKEFPKGVMRTTDGHGAWRRVERADLGTPNVEYRSLHALLNDPRVWVWGCGGPTGLGGHHGRLDTAATERARITIPREMLPDGLEEYAGEYGIAWYLDRTYGEP